MAERQTTIRLDEDLWRWLRREAFERDVSQRSIIEEALKEERSRSLERKL